MLSFYIINCVQFHTVYLQLTSFNLLKCKFAFDHYTAGHAAMIIHTPLEPPFDLFESAPGLTPSYLILLTSSVNKMICGFGTVYMSTCAYIMNIYKADADTSINVLTLAFPLKTTVDDWPAYRTNWWIGHTAVSVIG